MVIAYITLYSVCRSVTLKWLWVVNQIWSPNNYILYLTRRRHGCCVLKGRRVLVLLNLGRRRKRRSCIPSRSVSMRQFSWIQPDKALSQVLHVKLYRGFFLSFHLLVICHPKACAFLNNDTLTPNNVLSHNS